MLFSNFTVLSPLLLCFDQTRNILKIQTVLTVAIAVATAQAIAMEKLLC